MTDKQKREKIVLAGWGYYVFVHQPQKDEKYGDKYKVDLVVEDEDGNPFMYPSPLTGKEVNMVEFCKENNIKLQTSKGIPGKFVSVRSKAEFVITNEAGKKEFKEREAIPAFFADKTVISKETLIGNGSELRVLASVSRWVDEDGVKQTTLYLDRIIVDKLVEYHPKNEESAFYDFQQSNKKTSKKEGEAEVPFEE